MYRSHRDERLVASRREDLSDAGAYNPTVIEDFFFLDEWEEGRARSFERLLQSTTNPPCGPSPLRREALERRWCTWPVRG
jgi:hypothetical protein